MNGEVTERIAKLIRERLPPEYEVLHDPHSHEKGKDRIVSRVRGERLSYIDLVVVDSSSNELLMIMEVEESSKEPKRVLGDIFAVLMGDNITYGRRNEGRELKITSQTVMVVAISKIDHRRRDDILEQRVNEARRLLARQFQNSKLGRVIILPFEDEHELVSELIKLVKKIPC